MPRGFALQALVERRGPNVMEYLLDTLHEPPIRKMVVEDVIPMVQ